MSRSDSKRRRVRVEKGIYRRGSSYQVLVSAEGRVTFKNARTLTEARAIRGEILAKRQKGESVAPPPSLTLGEAIDAYLRQATLKESTREHYRHNLERRELRTLRRRKLASITVDDVASLVRDLGAPGTNMATGGRLAGSTSVNVLIALSSVFTLAVRRGWTQVNPVRGLTRGERPKSRKRPHRVLTSEEIGRVIDAAGDYRTLVTLAIFTGLRQSELLGLTWADLDLESGRLIVRSQLERKSRAHVEPKSARGTREVPLPAFVVRALRTHRLASRWSREEHPVFASEAGGPLDHRNVGRVWSRIRVEAGLVEPLPVFHDLRHTAASLLIAEGLNVVYVARVLGHSQPSITLNVYADLFDRERHEERATAALETAFGTVLSPTQT